MKNSMMPHEEIEEIVNRETRAWDTQNVDLLLSIFHPDMVWPWPPTADSHDPEEWVMVMGRFDRQRWGALAIFRAMNRESGHHRVPLGCCPRTGTSEGC